MDEIVDAWTGNIIEITDDYTPMANDVFSASDRYVQIDIVKDGEVYYWLGVGDGSPGSLRRTPQAEFVQAVLKDRAKLILFRFGAAARRAA